MKEDYFILIFFKCILFGSHKQGGEHMTHSPKGKEKPEVIMCLVRVKQSKNDKMANLCVL